MLKILLIFFCFITLVIIPKNQQPNLRTGWYYVTSSHVGVKRVLKNSYNVFILDTLPIVTSENISDMTLERDTENRSYLKIRFDSVGTRAWRFATMKSIGLYLGFILDDTLIQVSKVNGEIDFGVAVLGSSSATATELEAIKMRIKPQFKP